jgi:alpha-D-xyloside xylohydrolase
MRFDEQHYPSPAKMVDDLHSMNIRLMLSVWSKVDGGSELGKQIQQRGYYIPGTTWVDFFNPEAAKFYWTNFSEKLLKPFKIDAWWQDATEPENDDLVGRRIMGGKLPGEIYRNVYPLLVSKTVFEGLRADDPGRRAMILTRSGFPGIQRYGSVLWTGDVGNDWETLRRQIASGLGMMSSGHPWWTYDAGGFFRPYDQHRNQAYIECMLRWIETSVFFPMMRVHGYQSDTEPWRYGAEAERMIADNLALRYKLLPYIYSGAADGCFNGSTLMRPLVFDFADDKEALKQKHTFMFGKSMLVSPVTEAGAKTWTTYLPDTDGGWFDFWTNKKYDDGQNVTTPVTLDKIPVFVKAGSILPIGPERQYAGEKSDEPVELRVYPGDDASFALYEDEGDNYNYEKGAYSIINMEWDDDDRTLVIGKRKGEFEGMQKERQFRIVTPDGKRVVIDYTGRKVTVKL